MADKKEIKVIKNIGFLSILSEKENGMLKSADMIKNVGFMIVREDFHSKYPNISLKNIGSTLSVPEGAEVATCVGTLTIDSSYLEALSAKTHMLAVGAVIFEPETDAQLLKEKVAAIHLTGAAVCPEGLAGTVNSLIKTGTSSTITYPDDMKAAVKAENSDDIVISKEYIEALADNTILLINGVVRVTDEMAEAAVLSKIYKLIVNGVITISGGNQRLLNDRLILNGKSTVVPDGYEYVGGDIMVSENNIESFSGRNIFTPKTVRFDASLTPEAMEKKPLKFICKKAVCKKSVEKQASTAIAGPESKLIVYENEIIENHGKRKITAKELTYMKAPVHILNCGDMDFADGIDDDLLYEKISGIYNYGSIKCSEESYGLIQSKVAEDLGDIKARGEKEPERDYIEVPLLANLGNAEL